MLVAAFEFHSREDYLEALRIAAHYPDVVEENHHYCVMRERGQEVLTCREQDYPYLVYQTRPFQFLDANTDVNALPDGTRLFLRKLNRKTPDELSLPEFVGAAQELQAARWPAYIRNPDLALKRKVSIMRHADFKAALDNQTLTLPAFIKTVEKGRDNSTSLRHVITADNVHLFNADRKGSFTDFTDPNSQITFLFEGVRYFNEWIGEWYRTHDQTHSLSGDFIISEVMNISRDEQGDKGTIEYRCFVIDYEVINLSRYTDYTDLPVPDDAIAFARQVVQDNMGIFGSAYVLDIAKTDLGYQVVEVNPIANAGRYLNNRAPAIYAALFAKKNRSPIPLMPSWLPIPPPENPAHALANMLTLE